ncbi:hypothetical protein K466DRAFT_33628 [Polyporus arcularius HHB13444]|uniref:Uncharacterized protein n=1 Tax=Polyporus arcularius HHB13444 TaxID=1314778 RepID=A0A5C3NQW9_9APHY|nr:hypothetical protein K466DRAFT_33628 [Polyporus arcularius HHB13444]
MSSVILVELPLLLPQAGGRTRILHWSRRHRRENGCSPRATSILLVPDDCELRFAEAVQCLYRVPVLRLNYGVLAALARTKTSSSYLIRTQRSGESVEGGSHLPPPRPP